MKIDGFNPFSQLPASTVRSATSSKKPEFRVSQAEAEPSSTESSSVSGLTQVDLNQTTAVRQQRVEDLRDAIQNGSYQVSDRQIASALYARLLAPQLQ